MLELIKHVSDVSGPTRLAGYRTINVYFHIQVSAYIIEDQNSKSLLFYNKNTSILLTTLQKIPLNHINVV